MRDFKPLNSALAQVMVRVPAPSDAEEHEHNLVVENSESPIEAMFMHGLIGRDVDVFREKMPLFSDFVSYAQARRGQIVAAQQVCFARYRIDFCLARISAHGSLIVAVECDGREFHQLNNDQVRRDYERQRYLAREHIHVVRFLGSEIYADVGRCVDEALGVFPSEGVDGV